MFLGLYGYLRTQKTTKDAAVLLCHALHVVVGLGSWAYHMNVKYITQMGPLYPLASHLPQGNLIIPHISR